MKLLFASDLHGSSVYTEKLLALCEAENPERIILLGDLLYHGPRNDLPEGYDTKKVAAMLNGIADKLLCVRGNCDAEVDQMVLNFPVMADYAALFLEEPLYAEFRETVDEINEYSDISIIPVPNQTGSMDVGLQSIRRNVERAVGMDIFGDK